MWSDGWAVDDAGDAELPAHEVRLTLPMATNPMTSGLSLTSACRMVRHDAAAVPRQIRPTH